MSNALAYAEINLSNLRFNYNLVKKISQKKVMPVIKSNAYGHGIVEIARFFQNKLKVEKLGVARVNEGVFLRKSGIKRADIVILGGFIKNEVPDIVKYRLEPSVYSKSSLLLISNKTRSKAPVKIHVKVNTGMNRLGLKPDEAVKLINAAKNLKGIKLAGVYTHFANADLKNDKLTKKQIKLLASLRAAAGRGVMFHAANSAAIARYRDSYFDCVRPGIMLYGAFGEKWLGKKTAIKPVMTLKSRIINTIKLKKGDIVSYGAKYRAKGNETIAVAGIGYGDGFSRDLTNKWHAVIKGKKCRSVGTICMDMSAFKTGKGVKPGDEVVLFGDKKKGDPALSEMAETAGAIPYEILTGITERVVRVYKK